MQEPSDRGPVEDTLVTLGASTSPRLESRELLPRGATIDRYVVLEHLGEGGMGVVYVAYDPDLDRKVAVKLLRPQAADSAGFARGRARLLREAQALAKLTHPNVVAVHDVGTNGDEVFVAMELVLGVTLRRWGREASRAWPEVLAVLLQAGEGLAAAHAAGLVHRDFKPDNVMIDRARGADGRSRVRVLDFGLARAAADAGDGVGASSSSSLALDVTSAGAMPGTPAYMAPEQHDGGQADTKSDQFAFCVTAWESLWGVRPFEGATAAEVAAAMSRGAIAEPPRGANVPTQLRRVLERGLARDPAARHPSMRELLDALAVDPRRARRRWVGLGVVAVLGIGGVVTVRARDARAEAACEREAAAIDAVWDPAARSRLRASIVDTGRPYADATWARSEPRIDAYVEGWREARRGACRAATIEHTRTAPLDARAAACFDERKAELQAVVTPAGPSDPDAIDEAVYAIARLPSVALCTDDDTLLRRDEPDDDAQRAEVGALGRELAAARALRRGGRPQEASERALSLRASVEAVDWAPLSAELIELTASLAGETGDREAAERELEHAFALAMQASDDEAAFATATTLAGVVGHGLAKHERARWWLELAQILHRRLPEDLLRAATLDGAIGMNAFAAGEYGEAILWHGARLVALERALGADHPELAIALTDLANSEQSIGASTVAMAHLERALEIRRAELGEEHPSVGETYNAVGAVQYGRGDYEGALATFRRALAIEERAGDETRIAARLHNVATVLHDLRRFDEARTAHERALALQEHALGPDHPELASSLVGIGAVLEELGDPRAAIAIEERALAIREKSLPPKHPEIGEVVHNLGVAHLALGETEKALGYHLRAAEIYEDALGPLHVAVGMTWLGVAADELVLKRWAEGLAHAERALGILERPGAPPGSLPRARLYVAQALAELHREPQRVRELAKLAQPALAEEGAKREAALAERRAER